jgi:hypothetical protein
LPKIELPETHSVSNGVMTREVVRAPRLLRYIRSPIVARIACVMAAVLPAVSVVPAATVSAAAQRSDTALLTDPETYAVAAAALSVRSEQNSKNLVVLRRDTAPRVDWDCISGPRFGLPFGWQEILDDYARQNHASWQLLDDVFPERHVVAAAEELPGVRGGTIGDDPDAWRSFRERYAGATGYFAVSAVGYNETKTRAMVFVVYVDGPQSGVGYYNLLERGSNGWRRVNAGLGCGFIS